jgi:nitrogen-specific signal transduction histidine kinase
MQQSMTQPGGTTGGANEPSSTELVFAVCHELGNLLAGTRLEASLIDSETETNAYVRAAQRIESATARAGSLLASIRPLLDAEHCGIAAVDPLEVLAGLRSGLDASVDFRVAIDLKSAVELPRIRVPAEPLHHLLVSAIYYGLESGGEAGSVRVRAEADEEHVAFAVIDSGSLAATDGSPALRGRRLLLAIATSLVAPAGGRVDVSAQSDGTRLAVAFPAGTD